MSSTEAGAGAQMRVFTDWAADVRIEDVPTAIVSRLKHSVRDGLACAIYGTRLPWTRSVERAMVAQSGGHGPATVWGSGARVDAMAAAIANGTAIQSYELDDLHSEGSVHGTSAMLPAAMALAELRPEVSGADLLVALTVGWEAAVRVNRCIGHILVNGWHQPTMMGTIAAATACGRLLGLPPAQLYECVSYGVLQAAGLTVVQYGGSAKRIYAGRAAESGVQSALFAEQGLTCPDDAFGHEFGGFLTTYAPNRDHDLGALTGGLGDDFAASGVSFKLHACAGMNQVALDLLGGLMSENPEITSDNVASIELAMTEQGFKHLGFPYVPDTAVTAQFSVRYCLAVYLLEGAAFVEQFRDELLADPQLLDVVSRIETVCDPSLQTSDLRSKRAQRLRVTLRDGSRFECAGMLARGHADRPATEDQLRAKYERLVAGMLEPEVVKQLSERIESLEEVPAANDLVRLCVPPVGLNLVRT